MTWPLTLTDPHGQLTKIFQFFVREHPWQKIYNSPEQHP